MPVLEFKFYSLPEVGYFRYIIKTVQWVTLNGPNFHKSLINKDGGGKVKGVW